MVILTIDVLSVQVIHFAIAVSLEVLRSLAYCNVYCIVFVYRPINQFVLISQFLVTQSIGYINDGIELVCLHDMSSGKYFEK